MNAAEMRARLAQRHNVHPDPELNEDIRQEDLKVVRFLDTREDQRWFWRAHEIIGVISTPCVGGEPLDPALVLRIAHEAFGPDCSVLW